MDEPDIECEQAEQADALPTEGLNLHYLVAPPDAPGFPWAVVVLCLLLAAVVASLLWLAHRRPERIIVIHQVMDGDSLSGLSLHYYGNPREWQRIYRENRSSLLNRQKLTQGERLRIPLSRPELERIRERIHRPLPPDPTQRP